MEGGLPEATVASGPPKIIPWPTLHKVKADETLNLDGSSWK